MFTESSRVEDGIVNGVEFLEESLLLWVVCIY